MKVFVVLLSILLCVASKNSSSLTSWCDLPPDTTRKTGISCAAMMFVYTFNSTSGTCEMYQYGGCGATENLFFSKEECITAAQNSGCLPLYNTSTT